MCESSTSQSLPVCARHRLIRWSRLALCGQEGWLWWAKSLEEVKEGRRHRSVVVVQGNDSDISCGEGAHPCATDPPPLAQHQTCHIMLIYGDGWTALSTELCQVHQRIYLFTRLKGAKASAKQRLTLGVSPGPEPRRLH